MMILITTKLLIDFSLYHCRAILKFSSKSAYNLLYNGWISNWTISMVIQITTRMKSLVPFSVIFAGHRCQPSLLAIFVGHLRLTIFFSCLCWAFLSDIFVVHIYQPSLSAIFAGHLYRPSLSATYIWHPCQPCISAIFVSLLCHPSLSTIFVTHLCHPSLSAIFVSHLC